MALWSGGRTVLRVFGLPIRVNLSWFILLALIVFTLARGFFPEALPGAGPVVCWGLAVVGAAGLFVSLLIHELCHSLVARWWGMSVAGITLFVFGGVSQLEDEPPTASAEFVMAVAGPLASVLIAGTLMAVWLAGAMFGWPAPLQALLWYLWLMNIILAAFNLLPAFPLDGGRVLRSILWGAASDLRLATHVAARVGALFGLGLIVMGAVLLLNGGALAGTWSMIIGYFLRRAAATHLRMMELQNRLEGESVARFMAPELVVVNRNVDLATFVRHYVFRYRLNYFPVVGDDGRLIGVVDARSPRRIPTDRWPELLVENVMSPVTDAMMMSPDTDAADVLTALRQQDERRLVVVQDGCPVGVVSLKELAGFLSRKPRPAGG